MYSIKIIVHLVHVSQPTLFQSIHIHPIQASSFGDFCIKFSTDKQDTTDGAGDEEFTNKNKEG